MNSALRLGLFYAAVFIGSGASAPYMPVWFKAHGLTGAQIGLLLSAPMLARAVTAPSLAIWADGFELRRSPMVLMLFLTTLAYAAIAFTHGFGPWVACWFVATTLLATVTPLTDVLVLRRAARERFNYGWPRGIGSAAYIVGNVGGGFLLARAGVNSVLVWTVVAALLATGAASFLVPSEPVHESGERTLGRERWRGLGGLLRDREFMLAAFTVGAIQATHAFYYGFSALVWRKQGLSEGMVGLLWGFGVAVEICFLWFMEPWRRRVGAERLLLLGGLGAVIRWSAFAFSPPLWLLFPLQALHTLTFTATFLAGLQLIQRLAPAHSASAAQTISSALSGGLLIGLATLASGALFDAVGAYGYLAMAALAAFGLIGAAHFVRMNPEGQPRVVNLE
ncbi:MAG: MFS transporter [Parcubacteria group bacterium]